VQFEVSVRASRPVGVGAVVLSGGKREGAVGGSVSGLGFTLKVSGGQGAHLSSTQWPVQLAHHLLRQGRIACKDFVRAQAEEHGERACLVGGKGVLAAPHCQSSSGFQIQLGCQGAGGNPALL
jgi:hypothetical protein